MSWDADGYLYRVAMFSTSAGANLRVTIPPSLDLFWEAIQADGDDVRVYSSDGVARVYDFSSFTYASKVGVIDFEGYTNNQVYFLYFGKSDATDGSGTPSTTSQQTGYIHVGQPSGYVFDLVQDAPGASVPAQVMAKTTAAQLTIWWRVVGLESRWTPYNDHAEFEEVYAIGTAAVLLAGAAQASMVTDSEQRVVYDTSGTAYIRMQIKAGTTATDYTISVTVTAHNGTTERFLTGRALLRVRNPAE